MEKNVAFGGTVQKLQLTWNITITAMISIFLEGLVSLR